MKHQTITNNNTASLRCKNHIERALINNPNIGFNVVGLLSAGLFGIFSYNLHDNHLYTYGFGFIGLMLGLYVLAQSKMVGTNNIVTIITPLIFLILGIGFSCLIHLRYETPYRLSDLKFYEVFVPLAVASFVYIFWISFFSIRKLMKVWKWLALLFLPFLVLSFILNYTITEKSLMGIIIDPAVVVVNYCTVALFIFCTISLFSIDYFKNIILNIAVLGLTLTAIVNISLLFSYLKGVSESDKTGMVIALSFSLLILLANIFNIIGLVKKSEGDANKPKKKN